MDDKELAQRLAHRDDAALESLVALYYRPLFRFLWHATGSWHDAEDLTSQAIFRAAKDIKRFRGEGPLKAYVFRVAHREFLMHRRRQGIIRLLTPKPPTTQAAPTEDVVLLSAALQRLPHRQREAFPIIEVEGLTMEEAGAVLGVSPGTVKSRCHYAKLRLRELLAPAYPEVSNYVAPVPD